MEWVLAKRHNAVLFSTVASALLVAWPFLSNPLATHATSFQNLPAIGSALHSVSPPVRPAPFVAVGPAAQRLIQSLKGLGLNPVAVEATSRDFFSAPGVLVAAMSDNFGIFEYPDANSAEADVLAFQKSAERPGRTWKKRVHLYASGTLIVFYLGEQKDIAGALTSVLGASVMR